MSSTRCATRAGQTRALQPQVFATLECLIRHRDRVVSKSELLKKLWPDVVVTDASVQRAISLARDAIDDDGARNRTVPKQGYRFVGRVETERSAETGNRLQPRFARSGDAHIAYHTMGEGTVWSSIVHAAIMAVQSVINPEHVGHLLGDVPVLLAAAAVLAALTPQKGKASFARAAA